MISYKRLNIEFKEFIIQIFDLHRLTRPGIYVKLISKNEKIKTFIIFNFL